MSLGEIAAFWTSSSSPSTRSEPPEAVSLSERSPCLCVHEADTDESVGPLPQRRGTPRRGLSHDQRHDRPHVPGRGTDSGCSEVRVYRLPSLDAPRCRRFNPIDVATSPSADRSAARWDRRSQPTRRPMTRRSRPSASKLPRLEAGRRTGATPSGSGISRQSGFVNTASPKGTPLPGRRPGGWSGGLRECRRAPAEESGSTWSVSLASDIGPGERWFCQ